MWILLMVTAALYSYFRNRATKTMVDLYFSGSSTSSQDAEITEFISSTGDNKIAKSVRVRSYHSYLKLNDFFNLKYFWILIVGPFLLLLYLENTVFMLVICSFVVFIHHTL